VLLTNPTNTLVLQTQENLENVIIGAACLHFHDLYRNRHCTSNTLVMQSLFHHKSWGIAMLQHQP
jgi:hypothetical protein